MKTSLTHPIQIAEIKPFAGAGKIGITFCPGKHQPHSVSGQWARDLGLDLDAIAQWGAAAVVSLITDAELQAYKVEALGEQVAARRMVWFHLPIIDASVPETRFERDWAEAGERLRALIRSGTSVLIHCRGGLGRAGTIAARLLVELGWSAEEAIKSVRGIRPGAIETRAQEMHVRAAQPVAEARPAQSPEAIRDRAVGALLGLAVGDALGTTLEFSRRDSLPRVTDLVGGGPFRLEPGIWTDDTSMALALADSLFAHPDLDEADLMTRFIQWHEHGEYSATGRCFDIGVTTRQALNRYQRTGDPIAGSIDPQTAGNGSLMRLAPVAVRHWRDRERLRDVAARQSKTTHGAVEAVDACVGFAEVLADAIVGLPRSDVLRTRATRLAPRVEAILRGSWRGKNRSEISSSGYVVHSLEAAVWAVSRTASFEEAVILAANLGDDADTVAAITGQLAGAVYGVSAIPAQWRERLAWNSRITNMADVLFDASVRSAEAC